MKLTIESLGTTVSVEDDSVALDEVVEGLIIPALLATGFQPESIKEVFGGEEDD